MSSGGVGQCAFLIAGHRAMNVESQAGQEAYLISLLDAYHES